MIPADLLDQLREKDPELWEKWTNGIIGADGLGITSPYSSLAEAWLQYCLQGAIRARGWHYSVSNVYQLDGARAMVFDGHQSWWHGGSTEAEALLRAYLDALGATE